MTTPTRIPLTSIRTDGGTQPRAATDTATVQDYADRMRDDAAFPPVVVFFDGAAHWLADGFHRYLAASRVGADYILPAVRDGTPRDAVLCSVGAKHDHRFPRAPR